MTIFPHIQTAHNVNFVFVCITQAFLDLYKQITADVNVKNKWDENNKQISKFTVWNVAMYVCSF